MKVLEINKMDELSIAEQFVTYHIVVKGIELTGGQTDKEKKFLIEMHLAPDSTGSWKVLLPPLPSSPEPVLSDSLESFVPGE